MGIRTEEGKIEAYVFERHVEGKSVAELRSDLASQPGVAFVAQFVGAFQLFARVLVDDLQELQLRIDGDYRNAGIHSDWSMNLTGSRVLAPKRASPDICALVCAKANGDPFEIIEGIDAEFDGTASYGAAVVTAADFDLLVDLGADTLEDVIELVMRLRNVDGIGRTATALADLACERDPRTDRHAVTAIPGPGGRGERKLVTMLFADLAGYTALAETLDPEDVYAFLRPTMAELQRVVESFGGSVPQIQGDGFMAVFGVPTAHEDDAERAVRAALAVRDRVRTLNARGPAVPLPEVHARGALRRGDGGALDRGGRVHRGRRHGQHRVAHRRLRDGGPGAGLGVDAGAHGGRRLPTGRRGAVARRARRRRSRPPRRSRPCCTRRRRAARHVRRSRGHVRAARPRARAHRAPRAIPGDRRGRASRGSGRAGSPPSSGIRCRRGRFLVGRCVPFGDRPPFAAIGDAVSQAIGLLPGADPPATSAVVEATVRRIAGGRSAAALAADLRTLLGAGPVDEVRSDRDAVRAARLVLEDLAHQGTVAVVLDDLQWADRSLRDLLAELHRDPWPAPVFVLGLSRERVTGVPMATLPGLDRPSMRHLAAAMLGDEGSGDAVVVPVARANGNALFLEEMVGMLIETGAVRHAEGGWHVVDPAALAPGADVDPAADRGAAGRAPARREAGPVRRGGLRRGGVGRAARGALPRARRAREHRRAARS